MLKRHMQNVSGKISNLQRKFKNERFLGFLILGAIGATITIGFQNCSASNFKVRSSETTAASTVPGPSPTPTPTPISLQACSANSCDVYLASPSDFQSLSNASPKKYCLSKDIDFSGVNPASIVPAHSTFVGDLNGCGYAVRNMAVTSTSLFDSLTSATVENITFDNVTINLADQANGAGLLAPMIQFSNLKNINLNVNSASISVGTQPTSYYCGLLGGTANGSNFQNINITGNSFSTSGCVTVGGAVGVLNVSNFVTPLAPPYTFNNVHLSLNSMDVDFRPLAISDTSAGGMIGVLIQADRQDTEFLSSDVKVNANIIVNANTGGEVGGVIGNVSTVSNHGLSTTLTGYSYSGNLTTTGIGSRGTAGFFGEKMTGGGGVGGIVGDFEMVQDPIALVNPSVTGSINVQPSSNPQAYGYHGGLVIGGMSDSANVSVTGLTNSAPLTVNGNLSNAQVGLNDQAGQPACMINGKTFPAGSSTVAFLPKSVATPIPYSGQSCAIAVFTCMYSPVSALNLLGVAIYGGLDVSQFVLTPVTSNIAKASLGQGTLVVSQGLGRLPLSNYSFVSYTQQVQLASAVLSATTPSCN